MKSLPVALSIFAIFASSLQAEEWKPIFNGKDLEGWKAPKDNIWWIVEDGILQVQSGPNRKGSILWTEKEYGNFAVELEFKFVEGKIDSGVHLRNSDQIQIGISGSLKRDMTGSPYIPKKGYPVEAEGVAALLKEDDWNTMKIKVDGMTYICHLNGEKVMTYTTDTGVEKGPIGLQLHAKNIMRIDYRNIRVAERD
ncbi:MAG: DUF1080 domain-containing protein [Verrucomicrobiota bacterium]